MTTTTRTLTGCRIYWDAHEGWVYRAYYDDGHEESGPWEWLKPKATHQELADSVVELAWQHGAEISTDVVACHDEDGGWSEWQA